jgi:hydrogenase expression/formation protein HypC
MCLAVPVRVVKLCGNDWAVVDLGGVESRVSLALVDGIAEGDYVIVHVGHAIARLDVEEAEQSLALFREIASAVGLDPRALPAAR